MRRVLAGALLFTSLALTASGAQQREVGAIATARQRAVQLAVAPDALPAPQPASPEEAAFLLGLGVGATLPTGELTEDQSGGFGLGWHIAARAMLLNLFALANFGIIADLAYHSSGGDEFDAGQATFSPNLTILHAMVSLAYTIRLVEAAQANPRLLPYFLAGLGFSQFRVKDECSGDCGNFNSETETRSKVALALGLGTLVSMWSLPLFFELRYFYIPSMAGPSSDRVAATLLMFTIGFLYRTSWLGGAGEM
jgi:opacity protein-like surface antigen